MCIRCSFTSENSVQVVDFACAALRANRRLYLAAICSSAMGALQLSIVLPQTAPLTRITVSTSWNICIVPQPDALQDAILVVQFTWGNTSV